MATASTTMTVEVTFSEEDRALMSSLRDALIAAANGGTETAVRSGKVVLPDGEEIEPSEGDDDDEFARLSAEAYEKAKSLLEDKPNKAANTAKIKAALTKAGAAQVKEITTVEQVKKFLKALG